MSQAQWSYIFDNIRYGIATLICNLDRDNVSVISSISVAANDVIAQTLYNFSYFAKYSLNVE